MTISKYRFKCVKLAESGFNFLLTFNFNSFEVISKLPLPACRRYGSAEWINKASEFIDLLDAILIDLKGFF